MSSEGAEAQAFVDVKREHRQRETDDEEGYKDHGDDRQQCRQDGSSSRRRQGEINGHGKFL